MHGLPFFETETGDIGRKTSQTRPNVTSIINNAGQNDGGRKPISAWVYVSFREICVVINNEMNEVLKTRNYEWVLKHAQTPPETLQRSVLRDITTLQ